MGAFGDPVLKELLAVKALIVGGWIVLALVVEQWRPAAPGPVARRGHGGAGVARAGVALPGYGAAWFARWGRNLSLFLLNSALSALFVLPVTAWAALAAP